MRLRKPNLFYIQEWLTAWWFESNYEYKGYGRLSQAIAKVLKPSITAKQLDKAIENEYSTMPNKFPQKAEIETDKIETYSVL